MDNTTPPPQLKVNYLYPMFEDYVAPKGALTLDRACHACFYYGMLACKARGLVGVGPESQIISYRVGDTAPAWMESRDEEIARSVSIIYGLESPDDFLKFKREAWAQAALLGIEIPADVFEVRPGVTRRH